jgi:hypothetical protein
MPSTVHVPVLGNVPKGAVIAGGLTAVVVGGWVWYRHATGQPTDSAQTDSTDSTDPNAPDQYGYDSSYGYDGYGAIDGGGYGVVPPTPAPLPAAPATNADWLRAARRDGFKTVAETLALRLYLGGVPLTHQQTIIVREAIGIVGDPPVPGANGYPPKWHSAPAPGHKITEPGYHFTTNGHQTVYQIAHNHGVTEGALVSHNTRALSRYVGSHRNVPAGIRLWIPAHAVRS